MFYFFLSRYEWRYICILYIAPFWFGLRCWMTSLCFMRQQMEDFTPLPLEMVLLKEMEVWEGYWVYTWGVIVPLWSTVNQAPTSRSKKGQFVHIGLATWQNEEPSGLFKCEKDVRVLDVLVLFCLAGFPPYTSMATDTCQEWLWKGYLHTGKFSFSLHMSLLWYRVCHFLFACFSEGQMVLKRNAKNIAFLSFWPIFS